MKKVYDAEQGLRNSHDCSWPFIFRHSTEFECKAIYNVYVIAELSTNNTITTLH